MVASKVVWKAGQWVVDWAEHSVGLKAGEKAAWMADW